MQTLTLRLQPLSAFATLPLGDTLFGQLCWLWRDSYGEPALQQLLAGYTQGQPFAVVSDALPSGYVPRPTVPLSYFRPVANTDRKVIKKQNWLPLSHLHLPFAEWLGACEAKSLWQEHWQTHNSLNRSTGTTGEGFAPYTVEQYWPQGNTQWDVHIVFDANRELSANRLIKAFEYMGIQGFGRDASIGLGKFAITQHAQTPFPAPANANAVLTLAPCTPQGLGFDSAHSYYQLFTRFGRHGAQAAQAGRPFKTPVLLAKTGALFSAKQFTADTRFIGQGLGGNGQLSKQIPATVQQAYAPVIPLHFVPNQELP